MEHLIRWHLEQKFRIDFDAMLNPEQRAAASAFEKMAEDHLCWAIVDSRWSNGANFARRPLRPSATKNNPPAAHRGSHQIELLARIVTTL
jgi:hypothetical protein